jgi:N-acetyl sugar amidotransferase
MNKCIRCLYTSNHPFGLGFNQNGLCSGCITHEEKFNLNWDARFALLEKKISESLSSSRHSRSYDCVVPIRGTPEYFYVLDVVKNRLNLNPLVVSYNSQFNSLSGVRNVDLIRETFDVDYIQYTSNPLIYKKLIKESLNRLNSMRWPFIAGYTQFPVQVAVEKKIPLIIWPYHQPTEQVGMHSYTESNEMTRRGRHDFDLMGIEPHEFLDIGSLIKPSEVEDIEYPANRSLEKYGIKGLYLSNYIPWDSRNFSEQMIEKFGAFASKNIRTFDTYDRIDDVTYMTVHDVLKQAKLGYSRITDSLCREIRFGRISKQDAISIESYYQAGYPQKEIEYFLHWLGMNHQAFGWFLERLPFGKDFNINKDVSMTVSQINFINSFSVNCQDVHEADDYILFGKGLWI